MDAPVGRTTAFAERGNLFMVGAAPGSGIRMKIVNNFVAGGLCQLNAEALTLGSVLGLDIDIELDMLATNRFFEGWPPR